MVQTLELTVTKDQKEITISTDSFSYDQNKKAPEGVQLYEMADDQLTLDQQKKAKAMKS